MFRPDAPGAARDGDLGGNGVAGQRVRLLGAEAQGAAGVLKRGSEPGDERGRIEPVDGGGGVREGERHPGGVVVIPRRGVWFRGFFSLTPCPLRRPRCDLL